MFIAYLLPQGCIYILCEYLAMDRQKHHLCKRLYHYHSISRLSMLSLFRILQFQCSRNPLLLMHKYKSNKPLSLKDKMKKMFIFLLGSMGSKSTLFNSGGLPVHALERLMIPNSNHPDRGATEYKIEFHDRSLQSNITNKYRKHMEIRDLIEDEKDEYWSFVPKAILDCHKRVYCRRLSDF